MTKHNLLRKQYTLNETNYQLKIPMELDACIPANDCVRLIRQFVEEMDLTALYATYERMPSEKYASPEIMLKIMLYAYHERKDVSSRTIEKNCKRDINYMYLLEGRKAPDHAAIARFRSKHFAKCARHFMAQMTKFLIKLEQVTTTEVFIDGTKIESAANRYTFVWRKAVTKHQARFLQKTALLVGDIVQRQELKPLWQKQVKKKHVKKILKKLRAKANEESLEFVSGRGHIKTQLQRDIEALEAALEKLKELFLGKTGIFDHSMRSGGQTARIYDCRVETLPERKNQLGEPYSRLVARAYLPRTAKNQDFITELDSGIKKEVSVGSRTPSVR